MTEGDIILIFVLGVALGACVMLAAVVFIQPLQNPVCDMPKTIPERCFSINYTGIDENGIFIEERFTDCYNKNNSPRVRFQ